MPPRRLEFLVCDRRVPALAGTRPTVATVLSEMGHGVRMSEDDVTLHSGIDVVLMWNNPGYYPRSRRMLLALPASRRPHVAMMFCEPLPLPRNAPFPRWPGLNPAEIAKILLGDWRATDIYTNAWKLRRCMRAGLIDSLFVVGGEQEEYAAERGYAAHRFDYGYHPSFGRLLNLERDIPVLFLGETRQWRRKRIISRLRSEGIDVTVRGSWHDTDKGLWGAERARVLNRARIVVHIQRYPGRLAAKRFVLAMANGALVVSEPCYRPDPFVPGVHFVSASVNEMPDVIDYYLNHPREREAITTAAHLLVTRELTWARQMDGVVEVIRRGLDS